MRSDGRAKNEIRNVLITRNYIPHAEGSVFIEMGNTKVICTVSIEEKVPLFLKGTGTGWITAEYGMLPRATPVRNQRESAVGRRGGRTFEIQRLIGRSLRSVVDLSSLGERTFWIDCDVVQADGGTRTTSITGAFLAFYDAASLLYNRGQLLDMPVRNYISAVSVGLVRGEILLDLNYDEDSQAEVDGNFVMTDDGRLIEIQVSAEKRPFTSSEYLSMEEMARVGVNQLFQIQSKAVGKSA